MTESEWADYSERIPRTQEPCPALAAVHPAPVAVAGPQAERGFEPQHPTEV